jgi:hypothetical protein
MSKLFNKMQSDWMKDLWQTPAYRKKMIKAVKHKWEDAKFKEATLSKLHTPEVREKQGNSLKEWWADPKNKAMMCEKRKEQAKVYKESYTKAQQEKWDDPEYYDKMCKIRKMQSQGNQVRHPKASWYRCKYTGKCEARWMRSGWEVAFALWLDFMGIKWEYETKRFWLSKGHYYTPDFYLPDQDTHVELKGWLSDKDKKKIEKFQKLYPDVKYFCFFQQHLAEVLEFHPKRKKAA